MWRRSTDEPFPECKETEDRQEWYLLILLIWQTNKQSKMRPVIVFFLVHIFEINNAESVMLIWGLTAVTVFTSPASRNKPSVYFFEYHRTVVVSVVWVGRLSWCSTWAAAWHHLGMRSHGAQTHATGLSKYFISYLPERTMAVVHTWRPHEHTEEHVHISARPPWTFMVIGLIWTFLKHYICQLWCHDPPSSLHLDWIVLCEIS